MEGYFAEKVAKSTTTLTNNKKTEQIDLTLKLSPCSQNAEEKWLIRSSSSICVEKTNSTITMENGDHERSPFVASSWQERSSSLPLPLPLPGEGGEKHGGVMRFGKLQTMRRVRTGKRLLLEKQRRKRSATAQPSSSAHDIDKLNISRDSCHDEGGVSSNIKTSIMQENESMNSPKPMIQEMETSLENPSKKHKTMNPNHDKGNDDDAMDNILRQMPNVTTTGDGPNGKRIEGLLYKYREGQVCIVCVCHGRFLSPAEFVMHAGGRKVKNPMKHITVCSNSF